jgi:hypothetical protein
MQAWTGTVSRVVISFGYLGMLVTFMCFLIHGEANDCPLGSFTPRSCSC